MIVENEKKRKYDVLANEMGAMHKCKTRIIPYVLIKNSDQAHTPKRSD